MKCYRSEDHINEPLISTDINVLVDELGYHGPFDEYYLVHGSDFRKGNAIRIPDYVFIAISDNIAMLWKDIKVVLQQTKQGK